MLGKLSRSFQLPAGVSSYADLRVRIRAEGSNVPIRCYDETGQLVDPYGIALLDATGVMSTYVLRGFDYQLDLMNKEMTIVYDSFRNATSEGGGSGLSSSPEKSITLFEPQALERVPWFSTSAPFRVKAASIVIAAAFDSPSVELNVGFGDNLANLGETLWAEDVSIVNTTTGIELTNMDIKTIPANVWVWLAIKSISGTVPSIHLTLKE